MGPYWLKFESIALLKKSPGAVSRFYYEDSKASCSSIVQGESFASFLSVPRVT